MLVDAKRLGEDGRDDSFPWPEYHDFGPLSIETEIFVYWIGRSGTCIRNAIVLSIFWANSWCKKPSQMNNQEVRVNEIQRKVATTICNWEAKWKERARNERSPESGTLVGVTWGMGIHRR